MAGKFVVFKDEAVATGELAPKTRNDYKRVTDFVVAHFGKTRIVADLRPEDFGELRAKFAKKNGLVSIASFVQRVRVLFK